MVQQVTTNGNEWQRIKRVVQSMTTSDNKWRVAEGMTTSEKSSTTSDNEWQRVTTNDNEWQRVVQQMTMSGTTN